MQGPTPRLLERVITTVAPRLRSTLRRRTATSQLNAASVSPDVVAVPVVSHALRTPWPIGTSRLIAPGLRALPPLWPGFTAIVVPESGAAWAAGVATSSRTASGASGRRT